MMSATESSSPPVAAAAAVAATTVSTSSDGMTDTEMTTMMNGNNNGQQQQQVDGELQSIMPSNLQTVAANSGTNGGASMTGMTSTTKQTIGTASTKPKQRHHHHHRHSLKSQPASRQQLFNIDDDDDDDNDDESDENILHHQYSSIALSSSALAISGGSSTDNDNAYITEIARRSIARAALHLGIEGMEGIALDTLGSVLLGYLEMVGTTISTNVEISGRSSAHVNAYDALNVISECTAPAAMQLGMGGGSSSSSGCVSSLDLSHISTADSSQPPPMQENQYQHHHQQRGWEGLASFLFGPEWLSIRLRGEAESEMGNTPAKNNGFHAVADATMGDGEDDRKIDQGNGNADTPSSAPPKKAVSGGKTFLPNRPTLPSPTDNNTNSSSQPKTGKGKQLLPNMMGSEKTVTFSLDNQKSLGGDLTTSSDNDGHSPTDIAVSRWHAPYLHNVPAFPVVINTKAIANPHRLRGAKITLSLHDYSTKMEACVDYSSAKRPKKGSVVVDDQETRQKAAGIRDEMAERAMRAALRIPDDVYSTMGTVWGSVRKENGSLSSSHATNIKLQTNTSAAAVNAASKEMLNNSPKPMPLSLKNREVEEHEFSATVPMPSYVPNFLPPFPSNYSADTKKHDTMIAASMAAASSVMGNIVSKLHNREKKRKSSSDNLPSGGEIERPGVSNRDAVRRSVIGLGRSMVPSYWGSNWLDADTIDDGSWSSTKMQLSNDTIPNTLADVSVERGTTPSSSSTLAAAATTAQKKTDGVAGLVAPLARASGSRLAKILEGSMNV